MSEIEIYPTEDLLRNFPRLQNKVKCPTCGATTGTTLKKFYFVGKGRLPQTIRVRIEGRKRIESFHVDYFLHEIIFVSNDYDELLKWWHAFSGSGAIYERKETA